MPRKKHNELVAGLFVVCILALTLGLVLWLGAIDAFQPAGQRACFTVSQDRGVIGLEMGNAVKINDETIGKIVDIEYDPQKRQTLYIAEIKRADRRIHADGTAFPDVPFIGGGRLVVTHRGSPDKPLADAKHPLPLGTGGLMGTLTGEADRNNKNSLLAKLDTIATEIQNAATNVAEIAGTVRNEVDPKKAGSLVAMLKKSLQDINAVTASIRNEMNPDEKTSLLAQVRQTVGRVDKAAQDLQAITADAKPKFSKILTDVSDTTAKIKDLTNTDVVKILADFRESNTLLLKTMKNIAEFSDRVLVVHRADIDEIIDNLAQVSVNLKATSKEVRRNPWKLLYTPDKPEEAFANVAEAARAFSSGASDLDQTIRRLDELAKLYPKGIPGNDQQLIEIRKKIEDAFARFSRVEAALWKAATQKP